MVKIITPDEVRKSRKDYIPEVIFNEINKLIVETLMELNQRYYRKISSREFVQKKQV